MFNVYGSAPVYQAIIEPSCISDTSHCVSFTSAKSVPNVTLPICCLCIDVFPKYPLVAVVSVLTLFNILYSIKSFALLVFPDSSVKVSSAI